MSNIIDKLLPPQTNEMELSILDALARYAEESRRTWDKHTEFKFSAEEWALLQADPMRFWALRAIISSGAKTHQDPLTALLTPKTPLIDRLFAGKTKRLDAEPLPRAEDFFGIPAREENPDDPM